MFKINMEFVRGMLFVRLEGVLSERTSKQLNEELDRMIYEQGIRYFVINLENLTSIDEVGIKSIMDHYFDVIMHDGKLVVCGYDSIIHRKVTKEINLAFQNIESSSNELGAFRLINI